MFNSSSINSSTHGAWRDGVSQNKPSWVAPLLLLPIAPLLIKNTPLLYETYLGRNVRENKNYELKKYNI
jgi:hypothetical protein